MVAEIVAGTVANSLALLADAGHMLTDAAALAFALFASSMAARPAAGAVDVRLLAGRDPGGAGNGITLGLIGRVGDLVRRPSARLSGGRARRARARGRARRECREPRRDVRPRAREPREPERPRRVPPRRDRRWRRSAATAVAGALILGHRLGPLRPDREPRGRRADALVERAAAARVDADLPRARAERHRPGRDRPHARRRRRRRRGARPSRLDRHERLPGARRRTSSSPRTPTAMRRAAGSSCCSDERFGLTHTTLQVDHFEGGATPVELGEAVARRRPPSRR